MPERNLHIQGHRGARGLKPENTLPSFERAFDIGVHSVETDLHISRDGVPLLHHDPAINPQICSLLSGRDAPAPDARALLSSLTLAQIRSYRADKNPDPQRFPRQDAGVTPLAELVAAQCGFDPFGIPTLEDLFLFARAYTGELGKKAGKSPLQQARVNQILFDLELKRVPFFPEYLGEDKDRLMPGLLELRVVEEIKRAGMVGRTVVRSFDHRAVLAVKILEPELRTAIVISNTAPLHPGLLARQARADIYCPDYLFLDREQVRLAQQEGIQVFPWTVNQEADWERLIDWGVEGITTDDPDRLLAFSQTTTRGEGFPVSIEND